MLSLQLCGPAKCYRSKNNGCGLNGEGCLPFENSTVAFRCPADCITGSQVLNPRAVGTEVVAYRTFVVGGPTAEEASSKESYGTYRADSFVCASAIHAGLITPRFGGCGVLSQIGESANFPSSDRNGISSISFDARFPSSYTFLPGVRSSSCRDLRWHLFAVSIPFTTVLSLVSPSPAIPFFATFAGIFFHVALASDPPYLTNPYDMVSRALSRFLPAIFIAHFLWSYVLRRPHRLAPNVERTILYLGGLWVGALTNITLDAMIPINRLTGRDLEQQPGAKAALAIIVIILCVLVVGQVHFLRLSGQLPTMLGVYAAIGVGLGLLASIPGTTLRIHHYIIGLLLVPGCRVCTRPALLYQGLLLGLFINGIARWGFAGIVETPGSLQGDGLYFSTVPEFLPAPVAAPGNVTVYWPWMPEAAGAPGSSNEAVGVSVIVNDVERYEWRAAMAGNTSVLEGEYTFSRGGGEKSYLRLAWMLRSGQTLDYTRAGVVEADGEWRAPEEGGS